MKEGWEYKKLGDVAIIINGFAFKSSLFTKEGEKILRISNIQNDIVDLSDVVFFNKETYKQNLDKYKVYPDDILIALSGATTGKIGINKTNETLYLNQRVAICRESVKTLNHKYLYCFLKTKSLEFLKDAEGVAQPNLSTEQMKNYVLPIPPLSEQQHIVEELDLLSSIIEKKKAQIKELDNLAQSLFYEMFGDPISNEKGWEIGKISNFINVKGGFAFKSQRYTTKGIRLVQIANVWKDSLSWDDITYISEEDAKTNSSFLLKQGDIVMAMTRPIIQSLEAVKVAIVNEHDIPCILNQRVCKFEIRDSIDNIWLYQFLRLPYFKYKIKEFSSKGMQPNVSAREIESIQIFVPPFSLQQQFASKIKTIEHKKELIKQSIKEVETLFNSRMDYYFN